MMIMFIPILLIVILCCSPVLRNIFRASRDPVTGIPHRKLATLAILFTLCGTLGIGIGFFFIAGVQMFGSYEYRHDNERWEALDSEFTVNRKSMEEVYRNASEEERPALEKKMRECEKEYRNIQIAFEHENMDYTRDSETEKRILDRKFSSMRQSYEMAPVLLFALISLTVLVLFVPGTIFGWWYLGGIRKAAEKPHWLRAMFAALLWPCFFLWLIPLAIGVTFGDRVAVDFKLPHATLQFLGGMAGLAVSLLLFVPLIWLTYRWVLPKQKTTVPNPAGLAWWGLGVTGVGLLTLMGLAIFIFVCNLANMNQEAQARERESQFLKAVAVYEHVSNERQREFASTEDERVKQAIENQIMQLDHNHQQVATQYQRAREDATRNQNALKLATTLISVVGGGFGGLGLLIGCVLGCVHLSRARGTQDSAGTVPAWFSILMLPVALGFAVLMVLFLF